MRKIVFYCTFTGLFLFSLMTLTGCEKKLDCSGCDKEAPWSTPESDYCYPTEGQCETVEGENCQKCT